MPDWLDLLEQRARWEHRGRTTPGGTDTLVDEAIAEARRHLRPDVLQVLTPEQFAVAVRSAFKAATRPAELASNPLLRSRILPRPATVGELRDLLGREVEELAADPRRARLARVLTVTYLTPAATQEAAAARLSLPFSTYRRHLATALTIVTDRLWEREVGG